jgi:hypothetical protein
MCALEDCLQSSGTLFCDKLKVYLLDVCFFCLVIISDYLTRLFDSPKES